MLYCVLCDIVPCSDVLLLANAFWAGSHEATVHTRAVGMVGCGASGGCAAATSIRFHRHSTQRLALRLHWSDGARRASCGGLCDLGGTIVPLQYVQPGRHCGKLLPRLHGLRYVLFLMFAACCPSPCRSWMQLLRSLWDPSSCWLLVSQCWERIMWRG